MKRSSKNQRRSLQNDYVLLREIQGNALYLGSPTAPTKRELVASLKVLGTNLALKSSHEQLSLISRWRDLLASLHYPIQILTRILPLDMQGYLAQFTGPAPTNETEKEQQLREEHIALIKDIEQSHTLYERSSHIVIPSRSTAIAIRSTNAFLQELFWPPLRKRRQRQQRQETFQQLHQQLDGRARDLSRMLARMRLSTERLGGETLLHFYASCVLAKRTLKPIKPPLIAALDHAFLPIPSLFPEAYSDGEETEQPLVRVLPPDALTDTKKQTRRTRKKTPEKRPPPGSFSQVADLVTPAGITLKPNHVRLLQDGEEWVRTLVIDEMPRDIMIGWMRPLLEINEPFVDINLHILPRPKRSALAQLRRKRTSYKAARYFSQKHGYLIDDDSQVGEDDADSLSRKVASGEEHMHDVTCTVVVRAENEDDLDARTDRVMAILETLQVIARPAFLQQDDGYRTALPHAHNTLSGRGSLFLDTTSTAMAFFPFLATSLYMENGVLLGTTPNGDPIAIDKWQFNNANAIFVGSTGYGKSLLKKIWIIRLLLKRQKERRQIIVFDPDEEYIELGNAFNGERVKLASGSSYRMNPFDLFYGQDTLYDGDRLAEKMTWLRQSFSILLGKKELNGSITSPDAEVLGAMEHACYEAYRRVGITDNATAKGRQAPYLRDFYEVLKNMKEHGEETFNLISLLYPYVHGTYRSFFDGPTNVRLESDLILFDTKGLADEIAPFMLSMLSDFVWSVSFKHDMPRELIIDEAGNLAHIPAWARFMTTIVTRARKHWLAVTLIIQNMEQFQANPYARNLIDNCDIKVVVGNPRTSTIKDEFSLSDQEEEMISTLDRGEALIITPLRRLFAHIEASPLEYQIGTTKGSEVNERNKLALAASQTDSILTHGQEEAFALQQSVSLIQKEGREEM
jgi:hypothetical protein